MATCPMGIYLVEGSPEYNYHQTASDFITLYQSDVHIREMFQGPKMHFKIGTIWAFVKYIHARKELMNLMSF